MKPILLGTVMFVMTVQTSVSAEPAKAPLAAFKEYLAKNHKDKKWGSGPTQLESKELRKAYPDVSVCYVFSSPPLPPGAPLPELIERHRRASEDFRKNYISVIAVVGKDGVRPLTNKVGDLSRGLMVVKTDDDAKVAAAAVLSICPEDGLSIAPTAFTADMVKVAKTDKGWTCTAEKQFLQGTVTFDAAGKLTSVQRQSNVPLPPSAPPRPR